MEHIAQARAAFSQRIADLRQARFSPAEIETVVRADVHALTRELTSSLYTTTPKKTAEKKRTRTQGRKFVAVRPVSIGTEWRPIPGLVGYEVSNTAQVRSYRQRGGGMVPTPHVLKTYQHKSGNGVYANFLGRFRNAEMLRDLAFSR